MYGYSGKILHIDLKSKKNWIENKPEQWYKIYIGGVSMASRLLWENIVPGCNPTTATRFVLPTASSPARPCLWAVNLDWHPSLPSQG